MKTHALFAALLVFAVTGHATAADSAWKARLAELQQPAADEIVITAGGDAIWNRTMPAADGGESVFSVFRASDIGFLNFEQIIADGGYPEPKPVAMAAPAIAKDFADAGINLVSLANNQNMDFGLSGIRTTHKVLASHGIVHAGAGADLAESLKPGLIEKKGLKVALLAFMVTPQFPQLTVPATEREPGSAPIRGAKVRMPDGSIVFAPHEDDVKRMETAIAEAKKSANVVLVSLHIHWGGPREEVDATGKQLIARAAIKAGADAVLGHGPQVVNGIEVYEGKPIFYSFGTFAWQFDLERYAMFPALTTTLV